MLFAHVILHGCVRSSFSGTCWVWPHLNMTSITTTSGMAAAGQSAKRCREEPASVSAAVVGRRISKFCEPAMWQKVASSLVFGGTAAGRGWR